MEAEAGFTFVVFLLRELPIRIKLLSGLAFRFRVEVVLVVAEAAEDSLFVIDGADSLDPGFALSTTAAAISTAAWSSRLSPRGSDTSVLLLEDNGLLASSVIAVVFCARSSCAGTFKEESLLATDAFVVDDAVLFFLWLDFLTPGRKVVRFFFVVFELRGINETPVSVMVVSFVRYGSL